MRIHAVGSTTRSPRVQCYGPVFLVADRPLHLTLRLRPVGAAGTNPEAPVRGETEELRILDQPPTLIS
jgi:hypothetical protein